MSTRYTLQYKYEIIGDGEWIDEDEYSDPSAAQSMMAKHIEEFPEMRCRIVKSTHKTEQVAVFEPLQLYKEVE